MDKATTQTLRVKAKSVVSIQVEPDKFTIVAFYPTKQTLKDVAFLEDQEVLSIVEDVSGSFVREQKMFVTRYEYSEITRTLTLDLEDSE